MTSNGPVTADRWAVSTRTSGAVLTAGVALPTVQLGILGIPNGFTPGEIESWLRDLAGVALETSRNDSRARPIPALLHHALTGLLFSQTELWSHTGQALPCAAVFVDGPVGTAFGWVGSARVLLLVNGEPFDPQWVIVRDEAGREAMSALLPRDAHVMLTIEYRPNGEDGSLTPASLDAECGPLPEMKPLASPLARPVSSVSIPAPAMQAPAPIVAPIPAPPLSPLPTAAALPVDQPGLAPDPAALPLDRPDVAQALPSTHHPSSSTFAIPKLPPAGEPSTATTSDASELGAPLAITPITPPIDDVPTSEPPPVTPALAIEPGVTDPSAGSTATAANPPAVWAPGLASVPIPSSESAEAIAPMTPPETSDPTPPRSFGRYRDEDEPRHEESGHPVGRWLSRVLGIGKKTAPAPDPEPTVPLSSYDALLGAEASATPEPVPIPETVPEPAAEQATLSLPVPDPSEPRPLPEDAGTRTPSVTTPVALRRGGLAPAGLSEILGQHVPLDSIKPLEGLTGVYSPSGTSALPSGSALPTQGPGSPPYPVIEVDVPREVIEQPVVIDHEPVGAAENFDIPPVPEREPAPPVTAASVAVAPSAVSWIEPTPVPIAPEPPEPPADFLAEFAASMETVEPAAPLPIAPTPVEGPPVLRVAPTPRPAAPAAIVPVGPPSGSAPPAGGPPARPTMAFLRIPTASDPVQVVAAEQSGMMREIPLPSRSAEMTNPLKAASPPPDAPPTTVAGAASVSEPVQPTEPGDDAPDGMLVATAATPMPLGTRSRLSSSWPALDELEPAPTPVWRKPWVIAVFIAVLFGVGWFVGHAQTPDNDVHGTPLSRALRSVGLGGARFTATIDSDPPGAWISIDGKELERRTPSIIELPPGEHEVTLSMPDLGSVKMTVRGQNGQKVKVTEPLHGSLDVTALDNSLPVKVSLDGQPQGWLPAHIEKLPPGLHELQFSGPNMQPWAQQVSVPIRKPATLVARPMMSPATGILQVQASINDDSGTAPLNGAAVFIDGEMRGSTPLKVELPRGPHSLRVLFQGENAPVQVIDLPGGNQRFTSFQFGLDSDLPPLRLQGNYATLAARRVNTISASLDGLSVSEIRSSFLHVKAADGLWRRIEMSLAEGPRGAVVSADFPNNLFDANGRAQWYLSASTKQGDELFTEMQRSSR